MDKEKFEQWGLTGFTEDEVNAACREYAQRFGLNPSNAPSTTGLAMIRLRASKIGKMSVLRNPGNLEKTFGARQPQAILWMREPGEGEDSIDNLYSWDKRASYLHACDIQLGVGRFTKYEMGREWRGGEFNSRGQYRNMAGVWRVHFDDWNESAETSGLIKTVFRMVRRREWFYTPMVVALTELGLRIRVSEGYAFSESSKLLTFWRQQFVDAVKPGAVSPALRRMIKSTYTQAIGLMGSPQHKDKTSENSLYRPDWRGQIVDCASARMLHNMAKVWHLYPGLPLALYDDCFYYLLDDHRPLTEVFSHHMGGMFTFKARYDVGSDEAKALLRCGKPAVFARDIKQWEVGQ